MFYKDWEPIYKKISKDLSFPLEKEKKAVNLLNKILEKRNLYSIKKLENLINEKKVIIFGAGPSIEPTIKTNKKNFVGKLIIAADGATTALLKYNILPDIIVTDLDGKISDQIYANLRGSIIVIHVHGDNIDIIRKCISEFKGNIIATTQINPKAYENIHNFGGITDGDRAVFLASHFNAKEIYLAGFDYNDKIGKYSFSKNKDRNLKMRKLKWCKYLIGLLIKDKQNIQEL